MSKNELRELEEIVLCFEEKCESACEKVLADGNANELDRLEDLLNELVKFDNIIYSKIQDYKGVK